jgi:hypothetical protein
MQAEMRASGEAGGGLQFLPGFAFSPISAGELASKSEFLLSAPLLLPE